MPLHSPSPQVRMETEACFYPVRSGRGDGCPSRGCSCRRFLLLALKMQAAMHERACEGSCGVELWVGL